MDSNKRQSLMSRFLNVWRDIAGDLWTLLCYIYRTVLLVVQQVKNAKIKGAKIIW